MEERTPLLEKIIKDHLVDLQNKNYKIAKEAGVSEGRIRNETGPQKIHLNLAD